MKGTCAIRNIVSGREPFDLKSISNLIIIIYSKQEVYGIIMFHNFIIWLYFMAVNLLKTFQYVEKKRERARRIDREKEKNGRKNLRQLLHNCEIYIFQRNIMFLLRIW